MARCAVQAFVFRQKNLKKLLANFCQLCYSIKRFEYQIILNKKDFILKLKFKTVI